MTGFLSIVIYYYLVAIAISFNGHSLEIKPFVLHGLTTYAIAFVFSSIYLYFELARAFKQYLLYSWIKPFVMLVVMLGYTIAWDFSLLENIYVAVQQAPLVMGGASITLIVATFFLAFRLINEKLRQRNIL